VAARAARPKGGLGIGRDGARMVWERMVEADVKGDIVHRKCCESIRIRRD
jgi:hypothetical protein